MRRVMLNTSTSLILKLVKIICGFILPQLMLKTFGSATNGLVNSIAQFLSVISFLELGVGTVVESELYGPLANKDEDQISKIVVSARKFFRILAGIFAIYVCILVFLYPITNRNFNFYYTASLIVVISIKSFVESYCGIVDGLLLNADQRGYISDLLQIAIILLNTLLSVVLIRLRLSVHVIKLVAALICVIAPACKRLYITKHYRINSFVKYNREPISQKWNGVAQHIAAVTLDSTDNIVLTLFSTLENVSIYSVYNLVVMGMRQLAGSLIDGIQAYLGELWAKQEVDMLRKVFGWIEWSIHTVVVFLFGCTAVLITPFIRVYTFGVTDANYIQPLFGVVLTLAYAAYCLKYPYTLMVYAAGHYRQTQKSYIFATIINISLSVMMVWSKGLIGVAIGTLTAMIYQLIWMAYYGSKNMLNWPIKHFVKQMLVDCISLICAALLSSLFQLDSVSYLSWFVLAIKVAAVWLMVSLVVNSLLYKEKVLFLFSSIKGKLR